MRFIADVMLGKLARWLRILGFDVLYSPGLDDGEILRVARAEDRVMLTRDTNLLRRSGLPEYVFVRSDNPDEQLAEVLEKTGRMVSPPLSRCASCNGILDALPGKESIRGAVPDFVFHHHDQFMRCRDCRKVYWQGSHHAQIMERVRGMLRSGSED